MKPKMRKRSCALLKKLVCFGVSAFVFLSYTLLSAEETAVKGIHIITDQAIVDSKAKYTEFSGNVKLTINDTQIAADWIKVTFRGDFKKISKISIDEKAIDTINAKGNVRIQMNDMVANTQEAVYSSSEDTFILTGEKTTISSGSDTIVSDRVTINMTDQTFKAESTGKTPVEAIFYNRPKEQP